MSPCEVCDRGAQEARRREVMKLPRPVLVGAILMILLGAARGIGGVAGLLRGADMLPQTVASEGTFRILFIGLILIGLLEIISAIGIMRLKRGFWILGIVVTAAFVVDGAINGYVLFGSPGGLGTIVNVVVAALIIGCLLAGRRAFAK
jgi:hypothetical protein